MTMPTSVPPDDILRAQAIRQLKKRRDFGAHVLVYVLVNTCIVVVWLMTNSGGFFWPVFPMVFWGIGLVMNAYDVLRTDDFSEDRIQREMARLRHT
jgi:2TM domain